MPVKRMEGQAVQPHDIECAVLESFIFALSFVFFLQVSSVLAEQHLWFTGILMRSKWPCFCHVFMVL